MIKIDFQEPTSVEWKEWRRKCAVARDEMVERFENGQKPKVTDLYKDRRMQSVYKSGKAPFYGKCVYCESNVAANHPGDIEHWRPKNRVTDETGRAIEIETEHGATVPHPGYYWLAYEWRNLLFACADCNRPSTAKTPGRRIGKWDQFPVRGFRARKMGEEFEEEPILLNPVEEDPAAHLEVDDTGVMIAKTDRGQKCIDIFGLNTREAVLEERKKSIENTKNALALALIGVVQDNQDQVHRFIERVKRIKSGAAAYSAACRIALRSATGKLREIIDLM